MGIAPGHFAESRPTLIRAPKGLSVGGTATIRTREFHLPESYFWAARGTSIVFTGGIYDTLLDICPAAILSANSSSSCSPL
jgi:hypothetical protein